MKTHLGNDFVDSAGVRVRNFQMVDDTGVAQAIADFNGPVLTRYRFVEKHRNAARSFLAECTQITTKP